MFEELLRGIDRLEEGGLSSEIPGESALCEYQPTFKHLDRLFTKHRSSTEIQLERYLVWGYSERRGEHVCCEQDPFPKNGERV